MVFRDPQPDLWRPVLRGARRCAADAAGRCPGTGVWRLFPKAAQRTCLPTGPVSTFWSCHHLLFVVFWSLDLTGLRMPARSKLPAWCAGTCSTGKNRGPRIEMRPSCALRKRGRQR